MKRKKRKRDDQAFSIANAQRRDTISYFSFDVIIIIIGSGSSFHSRLELVAVSSSFALINRSRIDAMRYVRIYLNNMANMFMYTKKNECKLQN